MYFGLAHKNVRPLDGGRPQEQLVGSDQIHLKMDWEEGRLLVPKVRHSPVCRELEFRYLK